MTFLEKMQAHKGGLIRVKTGWRQGLDLVNGKVGMVCDSTDGGSRLLTRVSLLIDGKISHFLLYEKDVEFL